MSSRTGHSSQLPPAPEPPPFNTWTNHHLSRKSQHCHLPQEALPGPRMGTDTWAGSRSASPPRHCSLGSSLPPRALARLSDGKSPPTVGPWRAGSRSGLSCHCVPSIKREIRKGDVGAVDSDGQDRPSPLTDRSGVSGIPWTQGLPRTLLPLLLSMSSSRKPSLTGGWVRHLLWAPQPSPTQFSGLSPLPPPQQWTTGSGRVRMGLFGSPASPSTGQGSGNGLSANHSRF